MWLAGTLFIIEACPVSRPVAYRGLSRIEDSPVDRAQFSSMGSETGSIHLRCLFKPLPSSA